MPTLGLIMKVGHDGSRFPFRMMLRFQLHLALSEIKGAGGVEHY